MPYVNCPNCGQKALTVASRCPQCGLPFENQFSQHQESGAGAPRSKRALFIAGAAVAILVMEAVLGGRGTAPPTKLPSTAVEQTAPRKPAPPQKRPAPAADSVRAVATPPAHPQAAPAPPVRQEVVPPAPASESPPAPAAAPAPVASTAPAAPPGARRLYANIWVNVRSQRSNASAVIQILRPGQAALVDTLIEGWYRVVGGDKGVGYVDKHFLQASPPADAQ